LLSDFISNILYHFVRTTFLYHLMILVQYHFVRILFCPQTILSIPFSPYHFVRMTFCPRTILSANHFVHTIFPLPHFVLYRFVLEPSRTAAQISRLANDRLVNEEEHLHLADRTPTSGEQPFPPLPLLFGQSIMSSSSIASVPSHSTLRSLSLSSTAVVHFLPVIIDITAESGTTSPSGVLCC